MDQDTGERPDRSVQGNWTCANCGAAITSLPFNPREGSSVLCTECWRNRPRTPKNFQR